MTYIKTRQEKIREFENSFTCFALKVGALVWIAYYFGNRMGGLW